MIKVLSSIFLLLFVKQTVCLYPFESETRSRISLNGLWDFKVDFKNEGIKKDWHLKSFKSELDDTLKIAVPSSYNDLYTNASIRDHLGWVWYNRDFRLNNQIVKSINDYTIMLRVSSCHYYCMVWLNGHLLGYHESGHLPFEFDITQLVLSNNNSNLFNLKIAANNTLDMHTIPPAGLFYGTNSTLFPPNYVEQIYQMDFFNYAGLNRDVVIYVKPRYFIEDIRLKTDYYPERMLGELNYEIVTNCNLTQTLNVSIIDHSGKIVASGNNFADMLPLYVARLWWPRFYGGSNEYAYLYTLKVDTVCGQYYDSYSLEFGFRTVSWSKTTDNKYGWLINSQPFYCMGVNRHEDFPVLGRGVDLAVLIKEMYLFDWLNVNCMRTSHYPYSEEFLQLADKFGIVIIDEVPAVGLVKKENFNNITLNLHKKLLEELYIRDKNHPSVVMWSIANEPSSDMPESFPYFTQVFEFMRSIDPTRPLTFTINKSFENDLCGNLSDIISLNRYYGWYERPGHLDIIAYQVGNDFEKWSNKYQKPVIISEYGADALPGLHCYPEQLFCEEYQETLFLEHHKVFDTYKNKSILYGELIWNFVDFMTSEDLKRPYGNHKGLFTRERQPKPTAFIVKNRYEKLKNFTIEKSFKNLA